MSKIQELISAYLKWLKESDDKHPEEARVAAEELKHEGLLDVEYADGLSEEEYFAVFKKYLSTLDGRTVQIPFGKPKVAGIRKEITRNIKYLLGSPDSPIEKAGRILEGDLSIYKAKTSFWTPLFAAVYPNELPNFNNKTLDFFNHIGIDLNAGKLSLTEKYKTVAEYFQKWIKENPSLNLYELDHLMHYGTIIPEGKKLVEELFGNKDDEMYGNILKFVEQARTDSQKVSDYVKEYNGTRVKVSFGFGRKTISPWMAFLYSDNEMMAGIYPGIAVFESLNLLAITYTISKTNEPKYSWPEQFKTLPMPKFLNDKYQYERANNFGTSYLFKEYTLDNIPRSIVDDLKEIIAQYKAVAAAAEGSSGFDELLPEYVKFRLSDKWDEAYKWQYLREGNKEVDFASLSEENIVEKFEKFKTFNPQSGSFVHFTYLSDLGDIINQDPTAAVSLLKVLFDDELEIEERIKRFRSGCSQVLNGARVGGPLIGFLLAIYNPRVYPIYKDEMYQNLKDNVKDSWPTSIEGKYRKWQELALEYGGRVAHLIEDTTRDGTYIDSKIKALNGQDFLYVAADILATKAPQKVSKDEGASLMNNGEITLNTILYGPPGTGKTYNTINKALEIIHGDNRYCAGKARAELVEEYKQLKDAGRIDFITFHQSYSYEEFVEGIRPVLDSDQVKYEIRDGIFKKAALSAQSEFIKPSENGVNDLDKKEYFKMSLGNTYEDGDVNIYDYCISNDCVALGWGGDVDYSSTAGVDYNYHTLEWKALMKSIRDQHAANDVEESSYGAQAIYTFANWLKKGDIVFISKGNRKIRAIGEVAGDYEYRDDPEIRYKHFRKVRWIVKDVEIPVERVLDRNLSQMTIYSVDKKYIKFDNLKEIINPGKKEIQNFVLIIDEINRGNMSKIFGELITLLEDDKRLGAANEITTTLPYSGEVFGVPSNLYVLGTMNTADRSIALLDVALRRRFSFEPTYPKAALLQGFEIDGLDLGVLLEKINRQIEVMIDPDHTLGHSYLLKVKEAANPKAALYEAWYKKIVPLLEEYFYGDWNKLLTVLGKFSKEGGFVELASEGDIKKRFTLPDDCEEYLDVSLGKIHVYANADKLIEALKSL